MRQVVFVLELYCIAESNWELPAFYSKREDASDGVNYESNIFYT